MFTEPSGNKVTNSILAAWKRELNACSVARCRYPTCPFKSEDLNKLKEHHPLCEIGLKTKAYACLKCTFRCQDRSEVLEHVLNNHVSESDAPFEEPCQSSSESEGDDDDADLAGELGSDDEDESGNKRKSIPQNTKFLDKAYGLTSSVLQQFKTLSTPQHIPIWLAQ